MITAKIKYKKPKLTVNQKATKKATTDTAKEIKTAVKGDVPKKTGALKYAIDYRIVAKRGRYLAVVGVKSRYSKVVKGKTKIPNLYALKVGAKLILQKYINQNTVAKLKQRIKDILV